MVLKSSHCGRACLNCSLLNVMSIQSASRQADQFGNLDGRRSNMVSPFERPSSAVRGSPSGAYAGWCRPL